MTGTQPYLCQWYTGWSVFLAIQMGMSIFMLNWADNMGVAKDPSHLGFPTFLYVILGVCSVAALVTAIARLQRSRLAPTISLVGAWLMLPAHIFAIPGFVWLSKEYRKERDASLHD